MRGVPRERRAISYAPSSSMPMPSVRAERVTMRLSSSGVYMSRRHMMPNLSRSGEESMPARVVAPINVNCFREKRILRAEGPLPTMISRA